MIASLLFCRKIGFILSATIADGRELLKILLALFLSIWCSTYSWSADSVVYQKSFIFFAGIFFLRASKLKYSELYGNSFAASDMESNLDDLLFFSEGCIETI